jgi:hypothetical protein
MIARRLSPILALTLFLLLLPLPTRATCLFAGEEYSSGAALFATQAVQVCQDDRWQVHDVGLVELSLDLPTPKGSSEMSASSALAGQCVFYGGIHGNRLVLVNRCSECRVGTIRWTKWSGGSTIGSYRVPALNQIEIAMAGQSSSLIADNPCSEDAGVRAEDSADSAIGRLCIEEECGGCLSAPACVGASVGDSCTLFGSTGKCVQLKTCPRLKACCGCQVGGRIYACNGDILELGEDGESLSLDGAELSPASLAAP